MIHDSVLGDYFELYSCSLGSYVENKLLKLVIGRAITWEQAILFIS